MSFIINGLFQSKVFKFTLLILILLLQQSFGFFQRMAYNTAKLPRFKIELSLPVKERYGFILSTYKEKIRTINFVTQIGLLSYPVSRFGSYLVNKYSQDPEWLGYIQAVSEICGISLSEAFMLSVTYDMGCTTVIVQDNKGEIYMGRNLDFVTYYVIAHCMFEVEYYRNDKYVYTGIEQAGFRGAINAIKPGKFSAAINLRRKHYRLNNLYRIYAGYTTPNYRLMQVMEKADSYEEALHMIKNSKLSASVYYALSGIKKNEGAIISLNNDSVHDIHYLDVDKGFWFLVITNTDLDKHERPDFQRRKPTAEKLTKIGPNEINYQNLYEHVMAVYPANNIITIYTTIQSPKDTGYFNTTLWLP